MMDLNGEQYHRLQHAIALTRESLAIAAELGDDLSAFQLKHALHSLHYTTFFRREPGADPRFQCAFAKRCSSMAPLFRSGQPGKAFEIEAFDQQRGAGKLGGACLHQLIDIFIIGASGKPAHAADKADLAQSDNSPG